MNKLRNWLIHRLGGYTKDEQFSRAVQIVRKELPIVTLKAERVIHHDWSMMDAMNRDLKRDIVTALMDADPSPIKITCKSHVCQGYSVYTAEVKVCMPRDDV